MSFTSQESTISNETFGKDASFKLPQLIGSMSISPSGRDVVLGSKEGLHIIDLDSPYSPPRFLPHRTSWEVADVQWSPFADRDYWVVSTSNQKALVWNLNLFGWRNSIQHVLHGHTRAITDINFSAHHLDKLATCAVDSFVHCWDLRCPERPVTSFSDWFAGATQVKWSRQDEHVIASSHDKFLHIWDNRKGAYPARTIQAHDTKIYGIDWNRFEPSKIVTCSLDKSIKFWDTKNEDDIPERVIETDFPVWRARHTPFGWGLMVMPQRGNGDLHLYDRRAVTGTLDSGRVKPVHVFPGHKGQVKEFLWRFYGTVKDGIDHRDFQLVSWGTDRELRLHVVSTKTFEDVGYEKGVSRPRRLRFTRRGAKYRTFRDEPTEQGALLAASSRTESFPTSNQYLRVRPRPSTNIGMSRLQLTDLRGGFHAGKGGRHDMHGKGPRRPDTSPISWMKNVKIASWDTDSLADEITQVGEKFKNIDFETVDVSQRKATMSLQGPWGEQNSSSVYTRVDFRFPKAYPKDASAIVYVQKTNSIHSAVQQKLAHETKQIAEAHQAKGRGCIEAIVRYLLKEQTLDQTLQWLDRNALSDSKILEAASISGTESDDSEDDQLVTSSNVAQANANFNVPYAKGCAALWSEDGKLVCFFKQHEKDSTPSLGTLTAGQLDESDSNKLFGAFGKFEFDSPSRKAKKMSQAVNDDTASSDSDKSSLFSSSTSSSDSSVDIEERHRFISWPRPTLDSFQRGKPGDESQKSTTLDGTKVGEDVAKAFVKIYDLSDMLPARKSAAEGYQFQEMREATFKRNHAVAKTSSLKYAAEVWLAAEKALTPNMQENIDHASSADPYFQRYASHFHDFYTSMQSDPTHVEEIGSASKQQDSFLLYYLLPACFQFFEKCADTQMLAMLSANYLKTIQSKVVQMLVTDSSPAFGGSLSPSELSTHISRRHSASELPMEVQQHSHDARFLQHRLNKAPVASKPAVEVSTSVPNTSPFADSLLSTKSSSGGPSVVTHDPSGAVSTIHSLSGSPQSHRGDRRSEGTGLSAVAANLHNLVRSRPSSPPATLHRPNTTKLNASSKSLRASPDDGYFNDSRSKLRTSLSMANVSSYGAPYRSSQSNSAQSQPAPNHTESGNLSLQSRKKKLKFKLLPSTQPRNDPTAMLLSDIDTEDRLGKCLDYLLQYVPQLEAWQLWPERAEFMKLHARIAEMLGDMQGLPKTSIRNPSQPVGLELRRCCLDCHQVLSNGPKQGGSMNWRCVSDTCRTSATTRSTKLNCVICETRISGLFIPCLQCSHATCKDCAEGWFGDVLKGSRERTDSSTTTGQSDVEPLHHETIHPGCPTGCGCQCSSITVVHVPQPNFDSAKLETETIEEPMIPRGEGYQDNSNRTSTLADHTHRSHRGQSVGGGNIGAPESALNALLALQNHARHRSTSSNVVTAPSTGPPQGAKIPATRARENSMSALDELLPWVTDKNATLGKGRGPGLSRGLTNKASDSTIRKSARK